MSAANVLFAGSYWRLYRMPELVVLCFYHWNGFAHELVTQDSFSSLNDALTHVDSKRIFYPIILSTSGVPFLDENQDLSKLNNLNLFGSGADVVHASVG